MDSNTVDSIRGHLNFFLEILLDILHIGGEDSNSSGGYVYQNIQSIAAPIVQHWAPLDMEAAPHLGY